ncbi:MAG: outer membrane protein assembly factor BamB [Pseudomonadota bacterium]
MKRAAGLALTALLLGACASTPESGKPAPLATFTKELTIKSAWSKPMGAWDAAPQGDVRPVLVGEKLFVVDGKHWLRAYQARGGKLLWERRLGGEISAGITAAGEVLLLGTRQAEVLALSQKDGAPVWRTSVSSEVLAPPAAGEDMVVIRAGDGKIAALNLHDGVQRWVVERPVPSLTLRGIGAAVITDGVVYAGFANGKLLALSLRDGAVQWETVVAQPQGRSELERMVDVDARPLPLDDTVYAAAYHGRVTAVSRSNGRVLWPREVSTYTDLAYDNDNIYVCDEEGRLWALDRRSGSALWKQEQLHYRAVSAPVVFGDYLVVADVEGYLHWLARSDGHLAGRYHISDRGVVGTPLVADDLLYAVGADGTITALRARR